MPKLLLIAATELELCDHDGLVCGVGPVEAAIATSRALAADPPERVLHVGVAGGRRLTPGALVIGTESVYADISAKFPIVERALPDPDLVTTAQEALPESISLPIATSATVSGPATAGRHDFRVEGMEGFAVLRACAVAGVPAIEVRAISNDIGEGDRALWMIRRGLDSLQDAVPRLLAALGEES